MGCSWAGFGATWISLRVCAALLGFSWGAFGKFGVPRTSATRAMAWPGGLREAIKSAAPWGRACSEVSRPASSAYNANISLYSQLLSLLLASNSLRAFRRGPRARRGRRVSIGLDRPFGANLGPSWAILGHLGAILGPSWANLGHLGAILDPFGGPLGPSWSHF